MRKFACCCRFPLSLNKAHSFNLYSPRCQIASMYRDFCRGTWIFSSKAKASTIILNSKESQCSSLVVVATFLCLSIKADCCCRIVCCTAWHCLVASNIDFLKPPWLLSSQNKATILLIFIMYIKLSSLAAWNGFCRSKREKSRLLPFYRDGTGILLHVFFSSQGGFLFG